MIPLVGHLATLLLAWIAADLATERAAARLRARGLLDIPNDRSSHTVPVPRGGGIAIVAVLLAGTLLAALLGLVPARTAVGLIGGGALVGYVGWRDDHGGLRARTRALAHLAAAVWALAWLDGYAAIDIGVDRIHIGGAGFALATVGIVWGINFFNFMDGIDGLAAAEAMTVGLIGGVLLFSAGEPGLGLIAFLTAGAAGGFLRWNWTPARIFMGDVGSTVLGFVLAVLGVAAANARAVPMLLWGTLLGVFVFDATVTVARRVIQGYPFWQPHREFAFHRALRLGLTHPQVSGRVVLLNTALAALAVAGWAVPRLLLPAVALALGGLAAVYLWLEWRAPMYRGPERRWAMRAGSRYAHSVPPPARDGSSSDTGGAAPGRPSEPAVA